MANPSVREWQIAGWGNRVTDDRWNVIIDNEGKRVGSAEWATVYDVNGNVIRGNAPTQRILDALDNSKDVVVRIQDSQGNHHFFTIFSMQGFLPHPAIIVNQIWDAVEGGSDPVAGLSMPELAA